MARQKEQKERQDASTQSREQERTGSQAMQTAGGEGGGQPSQQTGLARREQSFPSLFSGSPFSFMRRFSEEMDRLFEDFGFGRGWLAPSFGRDFFPAGFGEFGQTAWSPQVEVFEREGQLVVRADLPGLTKDDVKVEVNDNALTISGERKSEHEERGEGFYRSERSYGSFYRQIPLPEGASADDADATFRNGVLEITMPAPQRQSRSRRLEITEGGAGREGSRAKAAGR
ncbi:MAG TPA: Hsp20/alpha crystallin family protein [Pyrinomonadaceae bacterium]|nr:Hsp20/alpha crystallin family protein [Pyrinomonadaceae bacterium]